MSKVMYDKILCNNDVCSHIKQCIYFLYIKSMYRKNNFERELSAAYNIITDLISFMIVIKEVYFTFIH